MKWHEKVWVANLTKDIIEGKFAFDTVEEFNETFGKIYDYLCHKLRLTV